ARRSQSRDLRQGQITVLGNGGFEVLPFTSVQRGGTFLRAESIASPQSGYSYWRRQIDEFDVQLFINDATRGGVALSYMNFGAYLLSDSAEFFRFDDSYFFHYGARNPVPLTYHSGTATYSGLLWGRG